MDGLSSEVVVTYLNIILYAISYQLQRPVEPFLVRSLIHNNSNSNNTTKESEESASNKTYGRLTSFFSLIQTIGSPLVGTLLDRIGPRRTSILVYGASATSYWILAHATSPTWLFWSKVPTVLQHAFLVGQATVSCVENEYLDENTSSSSTMRAAALGRMTTAYTVGATIGPGLGGILASEDLYAGARLAVWGSLASVLLSIFYLKDHDKKKSRHSKEENKSSSGSQKGEMHQKQQSSFLTSLKNTLFLLHHPVLTPLLGMKLLNGVSSSAFTTILPLILANKLHFDQADMGYLMSSSSFCVAIFAAVGITPAMIFVGNRPDRLALIGVGLRLLSIVMLAVVVSFLVFTSATRTLSVVDPVDVTTTASTKISTNGFIWTSIASIAISLSSHMHATSLTTLTTGAVSSEERGALLGLEHGLFAMARIVGPPLGTMLLSRPFFMVSQFDAWFSKSSLLGKKYAHLNEQEGNFMENLGIGGLWSVVLVCVLLDLCLLTSLRVWSANQYANKKIKIDGVEDVAYNHVNVECDDHDHSD